MIIVASCTRISSTCARMLVLSCHLLEQVNNLKIKAVHVNGNCLKRDSNRYY